LKLHRNTCLKLQVILLIRNRTLIVTLNHREDEWIMSASLPIIEDNRPVNAPTAFQLLAKPRIHLQ
jgi:hypothetical protein